MNIDEFFIKRGDRLPTLQVTLTDGNGAPVEVPDGTPMRFFMRSWRSATDDEVIVDGGTVTPVSGGGVGEVEYAWQEGDTDVVGWYEGEIEVEFAEDRVETFPNGPSYIFITISEDV